MNSKINSDIQSLYDEAYQYYTGGQREFFYKFCWSEVAKRDYQQAHLDLVSSNIAGCQQRIDDISTKKDEAIQALNKAEEQAKAFDALYSQAIANNDSDKIKELELSMSESSHCIELPKRQLVAYETAINQLLDELEVWKKLARGINRSINRLSAKELLPKLKQAHDDYISIFKEISPMLNEFYSDELNQYRLIKYEPADDLALLQQQATIRKLEAELETLRN